MSNVRVNIFSLSIDGYCAGPDQSLENPLGVGGMALHEWFFDASDKVDAARAGAPVADEAGKKLDEQFVMRSLENAGTWILGRNMFGPIRGPWTDDAWRGWWGENPPFHTPVFVLTHHARPSLTMEGGTTFHFVTDGIHAALERAKQAAQGKDIRIGGGADTIRQYLNAGLIDELHLAITPVLLGGGERLFTGVDMVRLGYKCTEHVASAQATHVVLKK